MIYEEPGQSLCDSVLVLNRFYLAVHVISVRRAFCLLYCESAEVIHIDEGQYANYDFETWRELSELCADEGGDDAEGDWVRTVSAPIRIPRVIRLTQFDRVPRRTLEVPNAFHAVGIGIRIEWGRETTLQTFDRSSAR